MTLEPEPSEFGKELRRRRESSRLTQQAIVDAADLSLPGYRRIEKGYEIKPDPTTGEKTVYPTKPYPATVIKLAGVLGWDAAEALELAGHDPELAPQTDSPQPMPPLIEQMWPRLTSSQRGIVFDIVKEFANTHRTDNRTREARAGNHTDPVRPMFSNQQ